MQTNIVMFRVTDPRFTWNAFVEAAEASHPYDSSPPGGAPLQRTGFPTCFRHRRRRPLSRRFAGWTRMARRSSTTRNCMSCSVRRRRRPGGRLTCRVGDEDVVRTETHGGVPVRWTTHRWRPEQLVGLIEQAGLRPVAELRLPAAERHGPGVAVMARRRRWHGVSCRDRLFPLPLRTTAGTMTA